MSLPVRSSLREAIRAGLLGCTCALAIFSNAVAQGGTGYQQYPPRPLPQSPLVGLPPTYIAPGTLPPWAQQPPQPPMWRAEPFPAPGQFAIPSDPGLSQRRLLDEELRLRGWQQDDRRGRRDNWNDDRDGRNGRDGRDNRFNDNGHRRSFDNR